MPISAARARQSACRARTESPASRSRRPRNGHRPRGQAKCRITLSRRVGSFSALRANLVRFYTIRPDGASEHVAACHPIDRCLRGSRSVLARRLLRRPSYPIAARPPTERRGSGSHISTISASLIDAMDRTYDNTRTETFASAWSMIASPPSRAIRHLIEKSWIGLFGRIVRLLDAEIIATKSRRCNAGG
jgi:hypothetical protein